MDIFPYYRVENDIIIDVVDACDSLSNVCKNCTNFKNNKLCTSRQNQITLCSNGMSVFFDVAQGKQYFSFRIRKKYNSRKIKCNDKSFKVSETFFEKYLVHVSQYPAQEFVQLASVFFENITLILNKIHEIIYPEINGVNSICYFKCDHIISLNELMDRFASIREETATLVDKIESRLSTLLLSSNVWNINVNSCMNQSYTCKHCTEYPCHPNSSDSLEQCFNGIWRYGFKNVVFFEIPVKDCSKRNKNRDDFELNNQYAICKLREEAWLINTIFFFQRFLHDVAQYFVGIRGLVPEYDNNSKHYCIRQQDVFTISVLYDAITALKYNINGVVFSANEGQRIFFEPYKLFDKYRICFTDISKIKIQIVREQGARPIATTVIGFNGFELVILNLLLNAIKYLPPQPFDNREVKIKFSLTDDLEIRVSSYGPPILDDEIEHLGEVGFRGSFARKYKIPGKGLGLNLIKELCRKNDYSLVFESNVEQKITFNCNEYAIFSAILTIPRKYHVKYFDKK